MIQRVKPLSIAASIFSAAIRTALSAASERAFLEKELSDLANFLIEVNNFMFQAFLKFI
jgi:hypothetical protein